MECIILLSVLCTIRVGLSTTNLLVDKQGGGRRRRRGGVNKVTMIDDQWAFPSRK